LYMENCIKQKVNIDRAISLSNCYLNKYMYKTVYASELELELNNYIPDIFRKGYHIPEFYKIIIKKKIEK